MKSHPLLILLLCSILCIQSNAEKYALIIAIGNYPLPEKNGWSKLSSGNDAALMNDALQHQGFKQENIKLVLDTNATKANIEKSIDYLHNHVLAGDIVVIHFSGYGEQLEDDNGDEADGLDEALVPYGAVYSADRNRYKELQKGYLRDDELNEKITALRDKLGANGDVLMLLDVCYSATEANAIGDGQCRGTNPPMVSFKFTPLYSPIIETSVFRDKTRSDPGYDACPFTILSAAAARNLNFECVKDKGVVYGPLSYAFATALVKLKFKTTYRTLFTEIDNTIRDIAPLQKPVMEGEVMDRLLFRGNYKSRQPYFTVEKWNTPYEFVIDAGLLFGVTRGSSVNLIDVSANDTVKQTYIPQATIIATDNYSSVARLIVQDTIIAGNFRAYSSQMNYGTGKLRLNMRNVNGVAKKVKESFKDFSLIEFHNNPELYLDTFNSAKSWALKYPNGAVYQSGFDIIGADAIENIKDWLKRFSRYRYLRGLNFEEEGLTARVELVFLNDSGQIDLAKMKTRSNNGRLALQEGDVVYLNVTNTGTKRLYVNVLDIRSDGRISPILPAKHIANPIKLNECRIVPGGAVLMSNIKITIAPPFGEETFKVFLSKDSLDLEDVLIKDNSTSTADGVVNNLAKVLINSEIKENGKRGGTNEKVNTDQGGTMFSLNFDIVPK
jgi:hypothetical protein